MTRSQLITKVANDTGISAVEVEKIMDGIFGTIGDVLKAGDKVTIAGFGRFEMRERQTKNFTNVMNNLKVEKGLVVIADNDTNVVMSARNVADVDTTLVNTINVYDVMKAKTVVLTKDAVAKIEEVYA